MKLLENKNNSIESLNRTLEIKSNQLKLLERELNEKDKYLIDKNDKLYKKLYKKTKEFEENFDKKTKDFHIKEITYEKNKKDLNEFSQDLKNLESRLKNRSNYLDDLEKKLTNMNSDLLIYKDELSTQFFKKEKELENKYKSDYQKLDKKENEIIKKNDRLTILENELNRLKIKLQDNEISLKKEQNVVQRNRIVSESRNQSLNTTYKSDKLNKTKYDIETIFIYSFFNHGGSSKLKKFIRDCFGKDINIYLLYGRKLPKYLSKENYDKDTKWFSKFSNEHDYKSLVIFLYRDPVKLFETINFNDKYNYISLNRYNICDKDKVFKITRMFINHLYNKNRSYEILALNFDMLYDMENIEIFSKHLSILLYRPLLKNCTINKDLCIDKNKFSKNEIEQIKNTYSKVIDKIIYFNFLKYV